MAIKKNITGNVSDVYLKKLLYGLDENDNTLYVRIKNISGSKILISIVVETLVLVGRDLKETILPTVKYNITPDLSGDNFIEQGYNHLKSLPEFQGFEDC